MRHPVQAIGMVLLAALLVGCEEKVKRIAGEGDDDDGTGSGDSDTDADTSGDSDADGDGGAKESCQFVDILFMIDQSPSMGEPQELLASHFPGFVDAMFDTLPPETNLHVGIVTSSFFSGSCSESTISCRTGQTPEEVLAHYTKPTDENNGANGGQGRLYEYEGKRYFEANTSGDREPLKSWFSGAAKSVGEGGCSYEMHSAAVGYAGHEVNAEHNKGFFRDAGALLVIFYLADEPDKSPEPLQDYHDWIASQKAACGGDKCIITAGLINPCTVTTNDNHWLFLNMFGEEPIWGSIYDQAKFETVVGNALAAVIGQTCLEIMTPE